MRSSCLNILACAAPAVFVAAQAGAWEAQVDLGISVAQGNTETSDTDLLVAATHEGGRLQHSITVNTHRSTATLGGTELTTQDVVDADYALQIQRTGRWYTTVNLDSYRDIGLDGRLTLTAGAGTDLLDSALATVSVDFGAGRTVERISGADLEESVVRWGVTAEHALSERLTLFGGARGLHLNGGANIYDGEAGVRLSLTERLSAGFRVDVHQEKPPRSGREPTDLLMSLTIGVSF